MKHLIKIILLAFIIDVWSCNFTSKQAIDSVALNSNLKITDSIPKKFQVPIIDSTYTKLIFPNFTLIFYRSTVYNFQDGTKKSDFSGDSSEVSINIDNNKIWTLTAQKDTVHLHPFYNQVLNSYVKLISKNKNDKYKISYISKIFAEEFGKEDKENMVKIKVQPTYKSLKDSSNYYFISESIFDGYINPNIDEVKKKMGLKDTLIRYKATDGNYYNADGLVSYKNKAYRIVSIEPIYFKVERFDNERLVETKFFAIEGESVESSD